MRLSEIITEAPVGALAMAKTRLAAPFSGAARGDLETKAAANKLWNKFLTQLGAAGIKPRQDKIPLEQVRMLFSPLGVTNDVIDAAVKQFVPTQETGGAAAAIMQRQQGKKGTPGPAGETFLTRQQAQQMFLYIIQNSPQVFRQQDEKVPSDVIDAVKKLTPKQQAALGSVLLQKDQ